MINKFGYILILAVFLASCGSSVYEENKDVSEIGWHKDSIYVFETD